ncbi:MAG: SDR family oxidoreductase [Candidatus Cyclobacteriaceae bacterium M2_1C_046]
MLNNKIIIVTGGSGLLGKAIVEDLGNKKAIVINLDKDVVSNLENGTFSCDVTSIDEIREAIDQVVTHFGKIDGLVNNAYPRTSDWGQSFAEMDSTSLSTNIEWQLNSYINFCREVINVMKQNGKGSIVNMASIYGIVGNDFKIYEGTSMEPPAAYAAIKGGVINVSRYYASKYGKFNIRVNCISPGGIFNNQHEGFVKAYNNRVPMGRMGNPEDIAPAVSFLLSEEAKYITGHNLVVDGGWTAI